MLYKGASLFHFHFWFNTSRSFATGFSSLLIRNDYKGNNFELQNFKKIKLLKEFNEAGAIFNKDKRKYFLFRYCLVNAGCIGVIFT